MCNKMGATVPLLNSMRNKQLLEFCLLCQKRKENNNLTKYSVNLTKSF